MKLTEFKLAFCFIVIRITESFLNSKSTHVEYNFRHVFTGISILRSSRDGDAAATISILPDDFHIVGQPSLLFLPGLDGYGNYSVQSFSNLSSVFNIWRLAIDPNDRSRFMEIAVQCLNKLNEFQEPPILVGESFGGILAIYLAIRAPSKIGGLVLVNPATSYDRTQWSLLGALISQTGPAFPLIGVTTLLATAVEPSQFQRIGRSIVSKINSSEAAIAELNKLLDTSKMVTNALPPDTLRWRLSQWLANGNVVINNRFSEITAPCLILVGENDRLLPSKSEGRRLAKALTNTSVELLEFVDSGHALLDGNVDLAKVIVSSRTFSQFRINAKSDHKACVEGQPNSTLLDGSSSYNDAQHSLNKVKEGNTAVEAVEAVIIPDSSIITMPPQVEIDKIDQQFGPFLKALSPVFLSRDQDGQVVRGLGAVPTGLAGRPVLLVGNHQLYGKGAECML